MKKGFRRMVVLALACVFCGCANKQEAGESFNVPAEVISDSEGEPSQALDFEADSFEIIAGTPFMIQEGAAYCWTKDNKWECYGNQENLVKLYREEYFTALDAEGNIICEDDSDEENSNLSAGYASYMKRKMLELNQEYAVTALNKGAGSEDWRALLGDGRVMVFMLSPDGESEYKEASIENETIMALAGDYALTDSGKVYRGIINSRNVAKDTDGDGVMENKAEEWFEWKLLVADKGINAIYASETSDICAGIKSDKTAALWMPKKSWDIDLSEWENVIELSAGFNYVAGLTEDGRCLYADADKEKEAEINRLLQDKKNVVHIACAFQTIALLYQDGTVEMIDLGQR